LFHNTGVGKYFLFMCSMQMCLTFWSISDMLRTRVPKIAQ